MKVQGSARLAGFAAALVAAAVAVLALTLAPDVLRGAPLLWTWDWAPSMGVSLGFMLDGLSLVYVLLISGIGAAVFLYSVGYMGGHPRFGRFVLYLFLFMVSMLGLVLARDLITLFVFWELTGVMSWLLIGFDHENPRARRNALQALLVTAAGALALLAGFILIGHTAGTVDLAVLLDGDGLQSVAGYGVILTLVLLGAFTKSAQFPFHLWLPNAMAAPTPVSAYLHSATMVKAGVYLLARMHPVLGGTDAWSVTLTGAGLVTMVMASVLALRQTDLKQALAYTTLMALGVITLMLAGNSSYALTAAMLFLIVHALYKAALFMVVGAIDHATGTREIAQLGGLRRAMPLTALAAAGAGLSMAGLPPFIGWIGKEILYSGGLTLSPAGLVVAGLVLSNALILAVAGTTAWRPFAGRSVRHHTAHEAPWPMLVGPLLLAALGLVFGLFAVPALQPVLAASVMGSLQSPSMAEPHLWAGVNLPLGLGLTTLALGIAILARADAVRARLVRLTDLGPGFDRGWDRLLDGLRWLAAAQTRLIQTGRLSDYLAATFAVTLAGLGVTLLLKRPPLMDSAAGPAMPWLIGAIAICGAFLALRATSRIAAIGGVGTVGVSVALIFVWFGAPDVAITQLLVETLSVVLFTLAALRLPSLQDRRPRARRAVHAVLSGGLGLCLTATVLAVAATPLDRRITTYFEENAYLLAHGRNIVNVVLVDFRAIDTFGEISVVLLASIGAAALLTRRRTK